VNAANASSLSVSISLPSGSTATDTVKLTISNGASNLVVTRSGTAGAGTITVSGLNVAFLGDGTLTMSAFSTDAAGNVGAVKSTSVTKDTAAPAAPTANYTDNNNAADRVAGTAEANAAITVNKTSAPTAQFTTTAAAGGAYSVLVAVVNGKNNTPISVTYAVTATDAAGNTSGATTITFSDVR
jgi:hypothetical protein